jgi:hypothetical protein
LIRRLVMVEAPRREVIEDQRNNRILPIEMSVLAVGYRLNGGLHYSLPPRPPMNLDPVVLVEDPQELAEFTRNLGYLRLILRAEGGRVPVDQLLVAHMNDVYRRRGEDAAWIVAVVRELIELLRSNYDVLIPTLEALNSAVPGLNLEMKR